MGAHPGFAPASPAFASARCCFDIYCAEICWSGFASASPGFARLRFSCGLFRLVLGRDLLVRLRAGFAWVRLTVRWQPTSGMLKWFGFVQIPFDVLRPGFPWPLTWGEVCESGFARERNMYNEHILCR